MTLQGSSARAEFASSVPVCLFHQQLPLCFGFCWDCFCADSSSWLPLCADAKGRPESDICGKSPSIETQQHRAWQHTVTRRICSVTRNCSVPSPPHVTISTLFFIGYSYGSSEVTGSLSEALR